MSQKFSGSGQGFKSTSLPGMNWTFKFSSSEEWFWLLIIIDQFQVSLTLILTELHRTVRSVLWRNRFLLWHSLCIWGPRCRPQMRWLCPGGFSLAVPTMRLKWREHALENQCTIQQQLFRSLATRYVPAPVDEELCDKRFQKVGEVARAAAKFICHRDFSHWFENTGNNTWC